jgi:hypothetical protein
MPLATLAVMIFSVISKRFMKDLLRGVEDKSGKKNESMGFGA